MAAPRHLSDRSSKRGERGVLVGWRGARRRIDSYLFGFSGNSRGFITSQDVVPGAKFGGVLRNAFRRASP